MQRSPRASGSSRSSFCFAQRWRCTRREGARPFASCCRKHARRYCFGCLLLLPQEFVKRQFSEDISRSNLSPGPATLRLECCSRRRRLGRGIFIRGGRSAILIAVYGLLFGILAETRKSLRPGMMTHAWHDGFAGLAGRLLVK